MIAWLRRILGRPATRPGLDETAPAHQATIDRADRLLSRNRRALDEVRRLQLVARRPK